MKLAELLAQIKTTKQYEQFMGEHPDAYFATCLLILDYKTGKHQYQLDYFIPSQEKLASFEYPRFECKVHEDAITGLHEQKTEVPIDIEDLQKVAKKSITEHETMMEPTKIIAVLKENEWNLTCMDDVLNIIRIKINAETGKEKSFKKESLLQFAQIKGGELGKKYEQAKRSTQKKV